MVDMPLPIATFMDGNDFWVRRDDISFTEGKPMIKIWLIPIDAVKDRLDISSEQLDTTEDPDGIIIKTYPLSCRIIMSANPERPRWLMSCDWRGNTLNMENPTIFPLVQLMEIRSANEQRIQMLESRIAELVDENTGLISHSQEWYERMKKVAGLDKGKFEMMPKELQGYEFDQTTGVKKTGTQGNP